MYPGVNGMDVRKSLEETTRYWEMHAQTDPMWGVLSEPTKRGRQWRVEEFFETGRREISLLMFELQSKCLRPPGGTALDFGCGLGRLTQALASHFDSVVGVDIAPTMIRLAEALNQWSDKVRYVINSSDDLASLTDGSFSFVYSDIVLQHLPPDISSGYIREFVRLLAPGGVSVFQLPSEKRQLDQVVTASEPMSPDAYRAEITVIGNVGSQQSLNAVMPVHVRVRNVSSVSWAGAADAIRLGNHWRDAQTGEMLIQDDARVTVPPLDPGTVVTLLLPVRAPSLPGVYDCELDVVHEGLWWFADRGSVTRRFRITVGSRVEHVESEPDTSDREFVSTDAFYSWLPSVAVEPGDFPMNGIQRHEVEELVHIAGATVRHVEMDGRCGREWVGYRYFIQR